MNEDKEIQKLEKEILELEEVAKKKVLENQEKLKRDSAIYKPPKNIITGKDWQTIHQRDLEEQIRKNNEKWRKEHPEELPKSKRFQYF